MTVEKVLVDAVEITHETTCL